jgi:hypothetical protein
MPLIPTNNPGDGNYVYPRRALTAAYIRAAAGLIMIGIPLILGEPGIVAVIILGGIALTFLAYGARTWLRGKIRIEVNDDGIEFLGLRPATLRWEDLTGVKLSYYSTRRDKTHGWMQLNILGKNRKLTIESTLDGFADVTRRVIAETGRRNIELSPSTRNNLKPLGISVHD